jgi:hypothetical protein
MAGRNQPAMQPGVAGGEAEHTESVISALDWAETAAMLGDFDEAVSWLDYVEWVEGGVPEQFSERRAAWLERASRNRIL